ncbi:MAG: acyl carrier protein [Chitinophaga sp.]|jgi:acyl carrier protein|nr:acyl carrier protein [Chitinophaga sp.]
MDMTLESFYKQQLKKIFLDLFQIQITPENESKNFTDELGIDSLDITELFIEVEKVYNIKISLEALEAIRSFQGLNDYLIKTILPLKK